MVFVRGQTRPAGAGRRKGQQNGPNALIKEAMLKAATLEGADGKGKDGLVGFFRESIRVQRGTFLQGMWKLLPKQIDVHQDGTIRIVLIETGVPARAVLPEIKDAEVLENGNVKALPRRS